MQTTSLDSDPVETRLPVSLGCAGAIRPFLTDVGAPVEACPATTLKLLPIVFAPSANAYAMSGSRTNISAISFRSMMPPILSGIWTPHIWSRPGFLSTWCWASRMIDDEHIELLELITQLTVMVVLPLVRRRVIRQQVGWLASPRKGCFMQFVTR